MIFQFPVKLNKEFILSKLTEEQIMEYYLNMPIRKGLFKSPLRVDHKSTCSIYRNSAGTLIYKDFATGQHLNCFGVVMEKFRCSYFEAIKIIANDFGFVKSDVQKNVGYINPKPIMIAEKEKTYIQIEQQPFTNSELAWWAKYGITEKILKYFQVYSCRSLFLNGSLFCMSSEKCPIYGYFGGVEEDMEYWRCYLPMNRDSMRFITNWPKEKVQGYKQLGNKTGKLLLITKSMKDVMCLHSFGIPAIAPNSEHLFIPDDMLSNLKNRFKYIVVLYDNDISGINGMRQIKKKYPELIYTYIPRKLEAKDFSDLREKYGHEKTKEFIIQFLKTIR